MMAGYRFNSLSQALKQTSAGLYLSVPRTTGSGSVKYVYKPILTSAPAPLVVASTSFSSHGQEKVSKIYDGYENWKSWRDVPDRFIPKTSKLDPNNTVYSNPTYIATRKKMIWSQRPGHHLIYLMNPEDKLYFRLICAIVGTLSLVTLYNAYDNIYKKYYPDEPLFYFF